MTCRSGERGFLEIGPHPVLAFGGPPADTNAVTEIVILASDDLHALTS